MTSLPSRLLHEVERVSTKFLLQDFRCPKTHLVSNQLLVSYSKHSQKLKQDYSYSEARYELKILFKIAEIYQFEYLQQMIAELLSS